MRYLALATDYDGTLATNGQVDASTLAALQRLRDAGRKLIMVTGRHLEDLQQTFPQLDRFDCAVVENGALLYFPATQSEQALGDRPPDAFIQKLRDRHVEPLAVGRVIVATWEPHDKTVLQTIRDCGLDLQISFNKGAVMVLPSGINKATGLQAGLAQLGLSTEAVVGVGDAENDQAFLDVCGLSVAVSNALDGVKQRVDWVTRGKRGAGVIELIDELIASDLQSLCSQRPLKMEPNDGTNERLRPNFGKRD